MRISAFTPRPLTLGELRELDLPVPLAIFLCDKSFVTQGKILRRLVGLPAEPTIAGRQIRVDGRDMVLTVDYRDR